MTDPLARDRDDYTYRIERCRPEEIAATDLAHEYAQFTLDRGNERASEIAEAAYVIVDGEPEAIQVLGWDGRYGLAWGADALWADARSLRAAVEMFVNDPDDFERNS